MKNKKAFTLIELLLVLAIVGILGAVSFPIYTGFYLDQILDTRTQEVVSTLRYAQAKSMAGEQDSSWGVYFDTAENKFVLFSGASYAARTTDLDQETALEDSISIDNVSFNGGGAEVLFTKIDGTTTDYGSLQLFSNNNDSTTISINAAGIVDVD